jgi:hypothetical protein
VEVPNFEELSGKKVMEKVVRIPHLMKWLPDLARPGDGDSGKLRPLCREYLFNVSKHCCNTSTHDSSR